MGICCVYSQFVTLYSLLEIKLLTKITCVVHHTAHEQMTFLMSAAMVWPPRFMPGSLKVLNPGYKVLGDSTLNTLQPINIKNRKENKKQDSFKTINKQVTTS